MADSPAILDRIRLRPAIRPLRAGLDMVYCARQSLPFTVTADGGHATIGAGAGDSEATLSMAVRHAAETALWLRLARTVPGRERRIAVALLAGHCAALALATLNQTERAACRPQIDPELPCLLGDDHPPAPSAALAALAERLLATQNGAAGPVSEAELATLTAREWFRQAWALAAPVDVLLTRDGDSRLRLDPESGLNRYGCSPRPRPQALTFASTTATSISDAAFAQAEALRRRLAAAATAGRLPGACAEVKAEIRVAIAAQTGAPPGTDIVLAPSGTDAELHALQIALAADRRPLTTIVIAPMETGSTVVPAASGRHHNGLTALGRTVAAGEPVDVDSAARVDLVALPLRDDRGGVLDPRQVDEAAVAQVEAAVAAGRRVLLHLLDTSKTGLVAPGVACVCQLARRFAGSLDVVVDAAQLRLERETVAAYLDHGFMVIVTGSKFFTGPPFAGALLIPPAMAARASAGASLPAGYAAYTERSCWPESWRDFCHTLTDQYNMGLMMRWRAALWEMEAFHAVPAAEARHILSTFLDAIGETIANAPYLRALPTRPPDRRPLSSGQGWDGLTTIYTFALIRPGTDTPVDFATTRRIYGWLNRDVAPFLPAEASDEEKWLARLSAHIGQPVLIAGSEADGVCGLRLAAGARLVSGAPQAVAGGRAARAFLDLEIAEAKLILAKIAMLLDHLDHLAAHMPE